MIPLIFNVTNERNITVFIVIVFMKKKSKISGSLMHIQTYNQTIKFRSSSTLPSTSKPHTKAAMISETTSGTHQQNQSHQSR